MLKVMTVIGTRPELIKMSRVIAEFDHYMQHVLVHTGQNYDYELNQVFFDELDIRKPDHFLNAAANNAAHTIGQIIAKSDEVFRKESPDALLLYGDTNSCLSVIAAKRLKIPVFHFEAGNRCFNERVPEEQNRKVVDHLSDINLVLSEHARSYLKTEGIAGDRIIKTGSHMPEVIHFYNDKIKASVIVNELGLKNGGYFLVSAHREENVDSPDNLIQLLDTLNAIADKYQLPILVSTHPRTRERMEAITHYKANELIQFHQPFGFIDYIALQKDAYCVISDSGTVTEEASVLGIPAITIREEHERPEGFDAGILIMTGLDQERVIDSIDIVTSQHENQQLRMVNDYNNIQVSKNALRIVQSYVDFINRNVWSLNS